MRDTKQEVIRFWFEETDPQQWFEKDDVFDAEIKARFSVTYDMARKDLCADWTRDAEGVLALCLVLDQFPRNMFRDSPKAFATDEKILGIVKEALRHGLDQELTVEQQRFVYMPFMHSENISDQKRSLELFGAIKHATPLTYDFAVKHFEVIEEFGRFPHRNAVLGRDNTGEEKEYLRQPDAGF